MLYGIGIICSEDGKIIASLNYSLKTTTHESALLGAIKNCTAQYDGPIHMLADNHAEMIVDMPDGKIRKYAFRAFNYFEMQRKGFPVPVL